MLSLFVEFAMFLEHILFLEDSSLTFMNLLKNHPLLRLKANNFLKSSQLIKWHQRTL